MWVLDTPIGKMYIVHLSNGQYGILHEGDSTVWTACSTPQEAADEVFNHVTCCDAWDFCTFDAPDNIDEWEHIK